MSGHLDTLNLVTISVGKGKGIDVITEVDTLNDYPKIKGDLKPDVTEKKKTKNGL